MDEVVYNAEKRLKNTRILVRQMLQDLKASGSIARGIFSRNLRAQHRQLFLGRLWVLLPGLAAAFAAVNIRKAGILKIGETDLPYPVFVVFGLLLWHTFVEALHGPIQAVSTERSLIRTQIIPMESVVLAKQAEVLLNFAVKFVFILGVLLWFNVRIQWTTLLLPIPFFAMILFATSIGLILAPFNLLYQDVSKSLIFLSTVWLFFTPILYPRPMKGALALIMSLNPVTPLFVTIRESVTAAHFTYLPGFIAVTLFTILGSLFAWIVFRLAMPYAIERLNY